MSNFTTKQGALFYSYSMDVEEKAVLDQYLRILEGSGVGKIIGKAERRLAGRGRPQYDPYCMFAAIVFGFATGAGSLRALEDRCRHDIRFFYLMEGKTPSYASFGNYINDVIRPDADEIFTLITSHIMHMHGLAMDDCFIDGTKIKADANKYKFVWKPLAYHRRLSEKARHLLSSMGLADGDDGRELIESRFLAEKLELARHLARDLSEAESGRMSKMADNLEAYMLKACEYEEKERICGPYRNSYYKTDHDATAMCLKEDYYSGLGSNMHPAYQIQLIVSCGFVCSYFVSQDRNDTYTFIPAFERFHRQYGTYPKRICADAGYGVLCNYRYCEEHSIEGFLKYQSWEGECSARRPAAYELNEDGTITCLGGMTGYEEIIPGRHPKRAGTSFFIVRGCSGCTFMPYCRRYQKDPVGDYKIFEINKEFTRLKQKARDLLLSVEGIEMRVNRSCETEGVFGVLKYDDGYDVFRRTGLENVSAELMLTILGGSIHKSLFGIVKSKYWEASKNTEPQKFKKPSAKRLSKRGSKQWQKTFGK